MRAWAQLGLIPVLLAATAACRTVASDESFTVKNRYWLASDVDSATVNAVMGKLRSSVAKSFSDGVLEPGYPRECGVTRPPVSAGPVYPECLQDAAPYDGLQLGSGGEFLQFVTLDFPSPRWFIFEVYLIPEPETVSRLTPEELSEYPRVGVPSFALQESTYRQWLTAVSRGIEAAGGVPF